MKAKVLFPLIVIVVLISSSCKLDSTYFYERANVTLPVTLTSIPATVKFPAAAEIRVQTMAPNGCYHDLGFKLSNVTDYIYSIHAYANFESYGVCSDALVLKDSIIRFNPEKRGTYYFKIHQEKNTAKIDSIVVN